MPSKEDANAAMQELIDSCRARFKEVKLTKGVKNGAKVCAINLMLTMVSQLEEAFLEVTKDNTLDTSEHAGRLLMMSRELVFVNECLKAISSLKGIDDFEGNNIEQLTAMLRHYNMEATLKNDSGFTLEDILEKIEHGQGMMINNPPEVSEAQSRAEGWEPLDPA